MIIRLPDKLLSGISSGPLLSNSNSIMIDFAFHPFRLNKIAPVQHWVQLLRASFSQKLWALCPLQEDLFVVSHKVKLLPCQWICYFYIFGPYFQTRHFILHNLAPLCQIKHAHSNTPLQILWFQTCKENLGFWFTQYQSKELIDGNSEQ